MVDLLLRVWDDGLPPVAACKGKEPEGIDGDRNGSGRVDRLGTMDGPFPSDRSVLSAKDVRRRAFERLSPSCSSLCVLPPRGEERSCSVEVRDEDSEGLGRGKKRS